MRLFGPCPTCGEMFQSRDRKIFCSMTCYHRSDQFQAMIAANNERKRRPKEERLCQGCNTLFESRNRADHRRFCNKLCRRRYFAARHDRWVANPQTIALPQDYDEFLTKDELPCIVEGCDWIGQSLSHHVNFAHGISAAEFKELAGFNRKSGLVSAAMQENLQARPYNHLHAPEAREALREHMALMRRIEMERRVAGGPHAAPARLERREHMRKVTAERQALAPRETYRCEACGKPFVGRADRPNRSRFCQECRAKHHRQRAAARQTPMPCAACGSEFLGNAEQRRRAARGLPVVCSMACRAKINHPKSMPSRRVEPRQQGPCPTCGQVWHGLRKSIYCSAACYYKSGALVKNLPTRAARHD